MILSFWDGVDNRYKEVSSNDPFPSMSVPLNDWFISRGKMFSVFVDDVGMTKTTIKNYMLRTGPTSFASVEDITTVYDFSGAGTGKLVSTLYMYNRDSNRNVFTYTNNGPNIYPGVCTNQSFVNAQTESSLNVGGATTIVSGTYDIIMGFVDYYLESSGSASSITGVGGTFFKNGKKLLVPPNSEILLRVVHSGTITGTVSMKSMVSFVEMPVSEIT